MRWVRICGTLLQRLAIEVLLPEEQKQFFKVTAYPVQLIVWWGTELCHP